MSKKHTPGRAPRPMGGGGLAGMAQQFQKMREEMVRAREELAETTLQVSAGGGMVTITITGDQRIQAITLKPEIVNAEDIEMLQDTLVAAINQALEQSQAMAAQRLEGLTSGLDLPGF